MRQRLSHAKTLFYRRPKDEFQRMLRWGPRAYFRCDAWAQEMEKAAYRLPKVEIGKAESGNPVEIWFLTGRRFWYQTAFCAWTFARQSGREVVLNLVDDGTLEARHEEELRRIFPKGVTLRKESVQERIETLLPVARFPILRQRWVDYVNIRKLTDIHLGSTGIKLVMDSDMLFFRRPDALLEWWDGAVAGQSARRSGHGENDVRGDSPAPHAPCSMPDVDTPPPPCLMTDCVESYGYSRPLMEELAGAAIPPVLNVGICGLRSEDLGWEELETWCRVLVEREGTSYFLEQALVAMMAARDAPVVMPSETYITFPSHRQTQQGDGILQHYVADSKPWYFGQAWKLASELK
jgi:hypothetical protein